MQLLPQDGHGKPSSLQATRPHLMHCLAGLLGSTATLLLLVQFSKMAVVKQVLELFTFLRGIQRQAHGHRPENLHPPLKLILECSLVLGLPFMKILLLWEQGGRLLTMLAECTCSQGTHRLTNGQNNWWHPELLMIIWGMLLQSTAILLSLVHHVMTSPVCQPAVTRLGQSLCIPETRQRMSGRRKLCSQLKMLHLETISLGMGLVGPMGWALRSKATLSSLAFRRDSINTTIAATLDRHTFLPETQHLLMGGHSKEASSSQVMARTMTSLVLMWLSMVILPSLDRHTTAVMERTPAEEPRTYSQGIQQQIHGSRWKKL